MPKHMPYHSMWSFLPPNTKSVFGELPLGAIGAARLNWCIPIWHKGHPKRSPLKVALTVMGELHMGLTVKGEVHTAHGP